ncbi:ATP-binding cassette domain-containing protein [Opitutus sp. ER46]|uniref:ATP-binding cassette domain-containing protein n=1 Tax=Opitutus sp. ER46 TaxID=2161864 RepID=UPI000D3064EC|nr:ATP-binding cassette domain-containing protein [Opitutus sp. ER46]PTX94271.1 hypothetical protein DB354_10935 [Opitutus sp. ER46]
MLSLHDVVVEFSGRALFAPLTFSFSSPRCGLVGASGSGKSTLARLLVGDLEPTSGQVRRDTPVHLFAQHTARPAGRVDDFLADLWATEAPASPLWHAWLPALDPAAELNALSGGDWMRVRLLRLLAIKGEQIILDEPTNHLDQAGRAAVVAFVEGFGRGLIVISHDRELLRHVDEIVELTPIGLQRFGGNFEFYWQARAEQRQRQTEALEDAERARRLVAREQAEQLAAQDRRMQVGRRRAAQGGQPRIVAHAMRRRAEETHGRLVRHGRAEISAAEQAWRQAVAVRQTDPFLRLDFASAAPPAGAVFFAARGVQVRFEGAAAPLWPEPLEFTMCGRERWQIGGANGTGKSTLLQVMTGRAHGALVDGELRRTGRPYVCLDQNQSLLPTTGSLLEALTGHTRFTPVELRNELAFYGFTGAKVSQSLATLSGGERLRAALAVILLGDCLPEAVLLDEPTNNLDFQSQELLLHALERFTGLLVVASHDTWFTSRLHLTHTLHLARRLPA